MQFDVVIIGAGAAGLFCAAHAGQRGLKVLLIDHADKVAEKIRISGGGRCNFTNRELDSSAPHRHYVGKNPLFCRSALARYTPEHFIALIEQHGIAFHEKHKGQLFCDDSSEAIIAMLLAECAKGQVERWQPCLVKNIRVTSKGRERGYHLHTQRGEVTAPHLVIATGGLSIPKIGATDFGYRIAQQFGIPVVEPHPGLVPLTFSDEAAQTCAEFAGMSLLTDIKLPHTHKKKDGFIHFHDHLLFTHKGLSGPAILQASNYWLPDTPIIIDLIPDRDVPLTLVRAQKIEPRKQVSNILSSLIPARLAQSVCLEKEEWQQAIGQVDARSLGHLCWRLTEWLTLPTGTEGWRKAEVTVGGIDTSALSQQSMECKKQPGLYFIGEVVDITGWLGGYNFQWAWASAYACAQALPAA